MVLDLSTQEGVESHVGLDVADGRRIEPTWRMMRAAPCEKETPSEKECNQNNKTRLHEAWCASVERRPWFFFIETSILLSLYWVL